jgi:hypothetical protein
MACFVVDFYTECTLVHWYCPSTSEVRLELVPLLPATCAWLGGYRLLSCLVLCWFIWFYYGCWYGLGFGGVVAYYLLVVPGLVCVYWLAGSGSCLCAWLVPWCLILILKSLVALKCKNNIDSVVSCLWLILVWTPDPFFLLPFSWVIVPKLVMDCILVPACVVVPICVIVYRPCSLLLLTRVCLCQRFWTCVVAVLTLFLV